MTVSAPDPVWPEPTPAPETAPVVEAAVETAPAPVVESDPVVAEPAPSAPAVVEEPEAAAPEVIPPAPAQAGLCPVCFPAGAPEGAETVGCEHGSWTVAQH
jgi:hypothetical protein